MLEALHFIVFIDHEPLAFAFSWKNDKFSPRVVIDNSVYLFTPLIKLHNHRKKQFISYFSGYFLMDFTV